MTLRDDLGPAPVDLPGLPVVSRVGPGSRSGWVYSPELGEAIAEQYAESDSGGLWELRSLAPDRIPPPSVIHAWKAHFPAFGLLMKAAEKVRAEKLLEQTIVLADTGTGSAQRIAMQIATRQHLAERLDRARFGKGGEASAPAQLGHDPQPTAPELSDEALASLAAAGANVPG